MARVVKFKGKTEEEFRSMSMEEFMKVIPSRERRTLRRGISDTQKKFLDKLKKSQKPVRTHCRNLVIVPEMLGKKVMIHSGKDWVPVDITIEMLGRRLGEFSQTRAKVSHSSPGVGATKSSKFLPLK